MKALLLAVLFFLASCGVADQNNSEKVSMKFKIVVEEAIKKAAPELRKIEIIQQDRVYSAEYKGVYDYDVRKNDSVSSPFVGEVSWHVDWYYNGSLVNIPMTLDATYIYQDGEWKLKSLVRVGGGLKKYPLPAEEYFQLFNSK